MPRDQKFKSRYPLLLPRVDDMTPKWEKVVEQVTSRPDLFEIKDIGDGFRMVYRKLDSKLNKLVAQMLTAMDVPPGGVSEILEIDPIQEVPPTLRNLWEGRGKKVQTYGVITLLYFGNTKPYQFPFIEVAECPVKTN